MFQRLVKHESLPLRLMNEGELNCKTVNDKSVTQTKYGQLGFTYPTSDQDLMDPLADSNFVNNAIRMEKEIKCTRMEKLDTVM